MPKKVRPGSKRLPPWQTPQTQCRGSYSRKMSKKGVFEQAKGTFSLQRRSMPTCTVRDKRSLSAKTAPVGSLLSRLMAKGGSHARVLKAGPRDGAVGLG